MMVKELVAKLGLDFNQSDFDKADAALNGLKSAATMLVSIFAAGKIASGIKSIVSGTVDAAESVRLLSERLGVSTQKLQELTYAAGPLGEEGLANGLRYLARNAAEAGKGNTEAAKAFRTLGVHVRDANGQLLPADELLTRVADGMQGMTNDTERVALSMQLFGRDGSRMINMLKDGSAGLEAMGAEARDLGYVMSGELMAATDENHKAQRRLNVSLMGLRNTIAAKLIPGATWLLTTLLAMVKRFRELLAGSKMVEVAITGITIAMGAMAAVASLRLFSALGSLAMSALSLAGAFGVAGRELLIMQLKASLIGLVILGLAAVIALLADEIWTFFTGGETVMGDLGKEIDHWYERFMKMDFSQHPILGFLREVLWALNEAKAAGFGWLMNMMGEKGSEGPANAEYWARMAEQGIYLKGSPQYAELMGQYPGASTATPGSVPAVAPTVTASSGAVGNWFQGQLRELGILAPRHASVNTNVTINGADKNPEQIGSAVANAIDEHLKNWVETQASDLLPRAGGT